MRKIQCLSIVTTLLFCFYSCKRPTPIVPMNPILKKYYCYKKGSYWVYRDSLNGDIDSFAVVSNNYEPNYTSSNPQGEEQEKDFITMFRNGSALYTWEWEVYNGIIFSGSITSKYSFIYVAFAPWEAFGTAPLDSPSIYVNDVYTTLGYFQTYNLNANTYDSVTQFHHNGVDSFGFNDNYSDLFYFNQDAWIIKMSFHHPADTNNYVLEQIRRNIIR